MIRVIYILKPDQRKLDLKIRLLTSIYRISFTLMVGLPGLTISQVNMYQSSLVDSLIAAIKDQKETNTKTARNTLKKLERTDGINEPNYLPYLDLLEGEILLQDNLEEQGLKKIENARLLFENNENEPGILAVQDALAKFYLRAARYPEALAANFKAIDIREKLGDIFGLAKSFTEVADIYWYYHRFEESIEYGLKAVHLIEEEGPSRELAGAYKILSESYLEIPDYNQSLQYIDRAIKMSQSLDSNRLKLASSLNSRGNIFKFMERYPEALRDYQDVLNICDSANYQIGIRASMANLGHVYLLMKDYPRAISFKLKSLAIQQNTGQVQQVSENMLHLSEAYAGLGKFDSAHYYQKLVDSVKSIEHAQALDKLTNELSVKYETEKKEESIKNLNDKVRLQKTSMILASTLLALSLIASLIFFRFNKQLKIKNQENEMLLKEIHHRVKNNLQILSSLLSLQSDHLKDANAIDALSEGKNRVESMSMIHQRLYQGVDITKVNMREYLNELCRHLEDSFSASNKLIEIKDQINYGYMDVDFAIPLGLIVNELVTNSVKYAFPNRQTGALEVILFEKNQELILSVSDDGGGPQQIEEEKLNTSFGSKLVETLSKKLKGKIIVDLKEGYSTTIKFNRYQN